MPFVQHPIDSPFTAQSTAMEVIGNQDWSGRTVMITGGSAGLGVETARAFAAAGADVVLPVRSPDKARAAVADFPKAVTLADLDLGSFDSVRRFASAFVASGRPLDRLINNAGIMATPEQRTPDGYELQFATNHLGHFLLTGLLLPALRKAPGARVVALSSTGHKLSPVVFDDIHFRQRPYDKWLAYGQAKCANALFALGFDRRFGPQGIHAYSVHPGGIMTDLQRDLQQEEMRQLGWILEDGSLRSGFKTIEQGAATSVWAATWGPLEAHGGVYCEDCNVAVLSEGRGSRYSGLAEHGASADAADRLWFLSERMVGERVR